MDALHPCGSDRPLSFVCCVSSEEVLRSNLLASPCLGRGSSHEVILVKNCPSAADGLNLGLERAAGDWVIGVHQDVFLPEGWDRRLLLQLREAERRFGPVGVAGVYGVGHCRGFWIGRDLAGCSADRLGRRSRASAARRAGAAGRVATLDELLLVVRRDTPLRFDPALGFHLYGATSASRRPNAGWRSWRLRLSATTTRGVLGCLRRFTAERPGLRPQMGGPAAGGHAVRDHRPVGGTCTSWAMPRDRGRLPIRWPAADRLLGRVDG